MSENLCPDCEQPQCPGYGCVSFQMEAHPFGIYEEDEEVGAAE